MPIGDVKSTKTSQLDMHPKEVLDEVIDSLDTITIEQKIRVKNIRDSLFGV